MRNIVIFIFLINLSFIQNTYSQERNLTTGWYAIVNSDNNLKINLKNTETPYFINESPIISIKNFKSSKLINSRTRPYLQIEIQYDEIGSKIWENKTEKLIGKKIGFISNSELLEVVEITSKISSGKVSFGISDSEKSELQIINKFINVEIKSLKK